MRAAVWLCERVPQVESALKRRVAKPNSWSARAARAATNTRDPSTRVSWLMLGAPDGGDDATAPAHAAPTAAEKAKTAGPKRAARTSVRRRRGGGGGVVWARLLPDPPPPPCPPGEEEGGGAARAAPRPRGGGGGASC